MRKRFFRLASIVLFVIIIFPVDDGQVLRGQEVCPAGEYLVQDYIPMIEELAEETFQNLDISMGELDRDDLLSHLYQLDPTTSFGDDLIDFDLFENTNLCIDLGVEGPKVLIYHTHSTEAYQDSRPGEEEDTVIGVGNYLAELLREKGIEVLHCKEAFDTDKKENAYKLAAARLPDILEQHPSIQVVIDLHRDGVPEDVYLVTEENGVKMAQVMFFNGISRDENGNPFTYLPNENLRENLAFSYQMQMEALRNYHNLVRKIYVRGYRYNMHFCKRSMLLEVGAQTNTVQEAKNSMLAVADLLEKVIIP